MWPRRRHRHRSCRRHRFRRSLLMPTRWPGISRRPSAHGSVLRHCQGWKPPGAGRCRCGRRRSAGWTRQLGGDFLHRRRASLRVRQHLPALSTGATLNAGLGDRRSVPAVQSNSVLRPLAAGTPPRSAPCSCRPSGSSSDSCRPSRTDGGVSSETLRSVCVLGRSAAPSIRHTRPSRSRCAKCAPSASPCRRSRRRCRDEGLSPIVLGPDGDDGSVSGVVCSASARVTGTSPSRAARSESALRAGHPSVARD